MSDFFPEYNIPSEDLHGDLVTISGMVKGNFFNSLFVPPLSCSLNLYKFPLTGSGK